MASFVALVLIDGTPISVNPDQVFSLDPVPADLLPSGVPAGTYVNDGDRQPVVGTVAAVAALLAAGAAGPGDVFGPRVVVGNVPAGDPSATQGAPFEYIGDEGDGAGIAAAFIAASAIGGTVYIRRGVYDFGLVTSPALPLTVAGFNVTGSGNSTVLRLSTLDRRLFVLSTVPGPLNRASFLADFVIDFTLAASGAIGTEMVDLSGSFRARVRNVEVIKDALNPIPVGPVLNPDESLTSIFRGGGASRFIEANLVNIDGTPGGTVVGFRLPNSNSTAEVCFSVGANVGFRVESTANVVQVLGCRATGGFGVFTVYNGMEIGGDAVRIEGCNLTSGVDGLVVESTGYAIVEGNNFSFFSGDGIRVDAGGGGSLVVANRMDGNALNILDTNTLVGMNLL